jgi:DNA uptake protein ComE-like DNA-binding protein
MGERREERRLQAGMSRGHPVRSAPRWVERGLALVVVLWVMVLLSFLCVSFARDMTLEMDSANYFVDDIQAGLAAASAVAKARVALASYLPDPSDPSAGSLLNDAGQWRRVMLTGDTSALLAAVAATPVGKQPQACYYLMGRPLGQSAVTGELGLLSGGEEEVVFGLIDEAAKLNVNTAPAESLAKLPGMTEDLAEAIVDFRDTDSDPQAYGAEDEYYGSLDPPYRAKNAPFESLEELLLVKGVTPTVLYGEDTNQNGVLDPWEDTNQDRQLDRGLAAYVTVYSTEPNVNSQGTARVNLNTATREEIRQALAQGMSSDLVNQVLAQLFPSGGGGGGGGGGGSGAAGRTQVQSMAELLQQVPALLLAENRKALGSLLDVATVSQQTMLPGLVNVNTAPPEVLAALPGLDEEVAQSIDGYRKQGGGDFSSVTWLLDIDGVGTGRFLQLLPSITARSFQYRVDALGVCGSRNVFRRFSVVLDRSRPDVPAIAWRDVTDWGAPLDLVAEAGEQQ